ncbi:MAG: S8 family serine peptidase, partial [Thermoproteota archaeon]
MKRKIISILALFLLTTSILMVVTTVAQPTQKLPVIIGFKRQSDPKLVRAHGGEVTHSYTIITAIAANVPQQAIESLSNNPNVAYLEMDHKVHALEDTLPWGVDRIDAEIVWGGSEGALSVTGNAGEGVQVAVVDTGVDYTHPDLDGNYLGGYDFVNGDDDPLDDNGHGTHVSGTIAAEDNKEGVIGVAPHAGLYALKALDNRGSGYVSDVVAGIEWAVKGLDGTEGNEDDAEVVSMSLGSSSSSTSLKEACNYAYNHGTLPVAAAGNEGDGDCSTTETSYPAAYESVMAVGATDKDDSIASFSNSGDYLELVAPGVDVNSTMPTYDVELTSGGPPWTRYSKNYDTMSGTSMACPHVSGTAALVFAAGATDSNGDGNVADDVRSILDSTAEDLDYDPKCQGNVLVDAEAAVDSTSVEESPTVSWVNPTNGEQVSGSVTIQINASDTEDDTETLTVEWKVDDGSWQTAAYNSDSGYYEDAWDSTGVSDGDHNLDARATDSDGNTTTSSITVTTENTDNAPTVSWVNPQDGDTVQDTVNMKIDASDDRDSGSDLTVKWQVDEGTWQTATYNSTTGYYEATWDSTSVSDGDYNL